LEFLKLKEKNQDYKVYNDFMKSNLPYIEFVKANPNIKPYVENYYNNNSGSGFGGFAKINNMNNMNNGQYNIPK